MKSARRSATAARPAWAKDTIWRADNFKSWRVIATGPIRAIFELKYDPWNVDGTPVSEVKRIAIDAGSNLYKATSIFSTPKGGDIPYVIGTLKRAGMVGIMSNNNAWAWLTGWGPVAPNGGGHGELGTAVPHPSQLASKLERSVRPLSGGEHGDVRQAGRPLHRRRLDGQRRLPDSAVLVALSRRDGAANRLAGSREYRVSISSRRSQHRWHH